MNITNAFTWLMIHVAITTYNVVFFFIGNSPRISLVGIMFGCFGVGFTMAKMIEVLQ